MLWRNISFALILGIFLTFPLHSSALSADPCYKLAKGLRLLGAETIHYCGTYFVSAEGEDFEKPARFPANSQRMAVKLFPGSGLGESYRVIQVCGEDYMGIRKLESLLTGAEVMGRLLGRSWQMECYLRDQAETPFELGQRLVEILGGSLYSIREYNGSVHVLAYIPWNAEMLNLVDGPVNLNLELSYEPAKRAVRLRAGSPVLSTLSHY